VEPQGAPLAAPPKDAKRAQRARDVALQPALEKRAGPALAPVGAEQAQV